MIANAARSCAYTPPRQCTRPDGRPKRRWPTERMAVKYGRQTYAHGFQTYRCGECLGWHNAGPRS
jgi:hypothetical protein